uniref:Uncharacterized protein n=1 Tax=Anguilla anguilla TaxID=7936 RepID=A0A0E9X292_ANGAN
MRNVFHKQIPVGCSHIQSVYSIISLQIIPFFARAVVCFFKPWIPATGHIVKNNTKDGAHLQVTGVHMFTGLTYPRQQSTGADRI